MNSYIVRVYRQDKSCTKKIVGIVEEVGVKGRKAFTDLDDLWEILNPDKANLQKDAKVKGKRSHKNHNMKFA